MTDFIRRRSSARSRLALATGALALPPVVIVQVVTGTDVGGIVMGLILAFAGTYLMTEFHSWLLDRGFYVWSDRLRAVANIEMDVPPWKALPKPVRGEYARRIATGGLVVAIMGLAVMVKDPNPFMVWVLWSAELQFLFVTRPTNEQPPPPPDPKPDPIPATQRSVA